MTDVRLKFKNPVRLSLDAALALEDYARAAAGCDAAVTMDAAHHTTGVSLASGGRALQDAVLEDIERFYLSLVQEAAGQAARRH